MRTHHLPASEQTVRVGVIDRAFAPVLTVDPGDEVVFETWGLWGNAVNPRTTFEDVLQIRQRFAGKGPHSLTGPMAIRGARAGMTLGIDILDLQPGDHGFNLITMGIHADLREAATQAVSDLVVWLSQVYGLTRADAYVLCSLQADLMITQAVNGNNGVHARLPRRLLAGRDAPAP